jgi:hypothetical protein
MDANYWLVGRVPYETFVLNTENSHGGHPYVIFVLR